MNQVMLSDWYVVEAENIMPHYCSNYYLAQLVVKNLKNRYSIQATIKSSSRNAPGDNFRYGSLTVDTRTSYDLENLKCVASLSDKVSLSWDRSYHSTLINILTYDWPKNLNKYDRLFQKIHAPAGVFCLTPQQCKDLLTAAKYYGV